jgi:DnaJ-class molecular chaperone
MRCEACEGTGWLRRTVPHSGIPGHSVTVTKVCKTCDGKGHVNVFYTPSGKDKATGNEESNVCQS